MEHFFIDDTVEKDNIGILRKVPVLYADVPGINGNVYENDEIKKAVEKFNKLTSIDPTYRYSYIRHPNRSIGEEESFELVCAWIENLYYDENEKTLYADFKLLPTVWGKLIKWLVKHNYPVGTSIRGTGIPVVGTIEYEGRNIEVTYRKEFTLKGIDFVVEPSFMTTHATRENLVERITKDCKLTPEDVISLRNLFNIQENKKDKEEICMNQTMINEWVEISVLKELKDRHTQELNQLKQEISELQEKKASLQSQVEAIINMKKEYEEQVQKYLQEKQALESEVANLRDKCEKLIQEVKQNTLNQNNLNQEYVEQIQKYLQEKQALESELASLKEKYEKLVETLNQNNLSSEYEEQIQKYLQEKQALESELNSLKEQLNLLELFEQSSDDEDNVVVRRNGKVFSKDNPPKIRLIDPKVKVSTRPWGSVSKEVLRKLAYLAYNYDNNKEVLDMFGLVDDTSDWRRYTYPVFELVKSEDPEYDFDAILNVNGLRTAYVFMMGRAGMALDPKEKKKLARKLLSYYKKLRSVDSDIVIPENLINLAERSIKYINDEVIDVLLERYQIDGNLIIEMSGIPDDDIEYLFVNRNKLHSELLITLARVISKGEVQLEQSMIDEYKAKAKEIIIDSSIFNNEEELNNFIKDLVEVRDAIAFINAIYNLSKDVIKHLVDSGIRFEDAYELSFAIILDVFNRFVESNDSNVVVEDEEKRKCKKDVTNSTKYSKESMEEELDMKLYTTLATMLKERLALEQDITTENIVDIISNLLSELERLREQVKQLQELLANNAQQTDQVTATEPISEKVDRKGTVNETIEQVTKESNLIRLLQEI